MFFFKVNLNHPIHELIIKFYFFKKDFLNKNMGNESTETSKGAETSTQNNNLKQPQNEENKNNKNKIINNNTIFVPQQDVDFKQILVPSLKSTHEQMVIEREF